MLGISNKKESIEKKSENLAGKVENAEAMEEVNNTKTSNTESEEVKENEKAKDKDTSQKSAKEDSASQKAKKKSLIGKKKPKAKSKAKPKNMPDGPIKKLRREDLLLLLKESMEENEKLKAEVARLEAELSKRDIEILNAGSIAKAALELNGVFEAAQNAAEQYLENVKRIVDENVKY